MPLPGFTLYVGLCSGICGGSIDARAGPEGILKGSIANQVPILYGGSVKANNAKELFSCPDVDGGLVGGASLVATDFIEIIRSLK